MMFQKWGEHRRSIPESGWNDLPCNVFEEYAVRADVASDFAAVAMLNPDRPAICTAGEMITYRQLAERVDLVAARLQAHGCGSESPCRLIGTLVAHTPAAVVHLLGILQARGVYCPIEGGMPVTRIAAQAEVLGLDRLYAAVPDPRGPANLPIERVDAEPLPDDPDLQMPEWYPSDPAYVLGTSGSTGAPKPVLVSRRALASTVRALQRLFDLVPDDRVLQFSSLGWDTCLEEILPTLITGAALIFDADAYTGSLRRFVGVLAERSVTVVNLPTAFWHELVLYLREAEMGLPPSIRLMVIGGDRVDPTWLRQWRSLDTGHIQLLNTYGCTETTMVTHAVQLAGPGTEADVLCCGSEVPLGRPLPHVRDYVTAHGELLVAGPCLATGYLSLPKRTASAFPVADHDGEQARWFATGDLVYRGATGLLFPKGRVDDQVKVHGVHVHPEEIEKHLNAHPAVAGAVVVGDRLIGRTSLVAYVVLAGAVGPAQLKQYLSERLPSQFVPSRVKFVAALSYTANGKVDREATRSAAAHHNSRRSL